MFSGIIADVGIIMRAENREGGLRLTISLAGEGPVYDGLRQGLSQVRVGLLEFAEAPERHAKQVFGPAALTPAIDGGWLGGFDPVAEAARVKCPVLLVVGDPACGGMLPPADADPLAAALADCTRVDLRGVGHLPHTQDPVGTLKLLHAFLDSL